MQMDMHLMQGHFLLHFQKELFLHYFVVKEDNPAPYFALGNSGYYQKLYIRFLFLRLRE